MLAGILEDEGDIRAAADLIATAPGAQESPGLLVRLGELLQKAGEPDQSRAAWNRAVALDPGDLACTSASRSRSSGRRLAGG
jgi:predicted TPR repeat methyltransferase